MEELASSSDDPEVELFWRFVSKFMSLQEEQGSYYNYDKIVKDVNITFMDISSIQIALWHRIPRKAQQ